MEHGGTLQSGPKPHGRKVAEHVGNHLDNNLRQNGGGFINGSVVSLYGSN